ncbi:hypothetical protein OAT84_02700 [Gammaproteobacteria bacterium]|nr:hypothetical protein [Gammaproteobacteria bacterium]
MTSIVFNRGGDIGAAKRFIEWWATQNKDVGIKLAVQVDLTSAGRIKGLETYAKKHNIDLIIKRSSHVNENSERLTHIEKVKKDQLNAIYGMSEFSNNNFINQHIKPKECLGIVSIPNWHRMPESLLRHLCFNNSKPFYPISEYNLLPIYGNLNRRRKIIEAAIKRGKNHIKPIEMGFGTGRSAIRSDITKMEKSGVFLPVAKTSSDLDSTAISNHTVSKLLNNPDNACYVGYFFQENLGSYEGEGRTKPWSNYRGKEAVVTLQSFCEMILKIAVQRDKIETNIILPGLTKNNYEDLKRRIKSSALKIEFVDPSDINNLEMRNDQDKVLRFIHPGMLPPDVFAKCILESEPLIGSTGDASFVEALTQGKIVLYQLMRWKTELLHSFVDMVNDKMPNTHLAAFYQQLLRHGEEDAHDQLIKMYTSNQERLSIDAKQLASKIKNDCDILKNFEKH